MKNCKLCKKQFKNIQEDYLCESCENDLSDSEVIRKIELKRRSIRKKIKDKKNDHSKLKVKALRSSTNQIKSEANLIKKFSYMIGNRSITGKQYNYLSYLQKQTALHDQQKNILAQIYSLSYQHRNETFIKLEERYLNLGFENDKVLTLLHYIQQQAPITISFNVLRDLFQIVNTSIVSYNVKGYINICNNIEQTIKHQQRGSESYFIIKEGVRRRCLLDVESRHCKISKVTLQFGKYLLNVISNNELSKALQGLSNEDIDKKSLGMCKQVEILGQIRLDRDIDRICVSCKQIRHDTMSLLKVIEQRYGISYQIFQS